MYQSDGTTLQDITGWSIQFKMAVSTGGTSVLTKSATLVTPAAGLCRVTVSSTDTSTLAAQTYHYTLSRIDSGFNQVIAHGPAVLLARVA